jgi:hypothetical protein
MNFCFDSDTLISKISERRLKLFSLRVLSACSCHDGYTIARNHSRSDEGIGLRTIGRRV